MSIGPKIKHLLLLSISLAVSSASAHDVPVHLAITVSAAASAHDNSAGYRAYLSTVSPDMSMANATNAMVIGSGLEDLRDGDEGGKRSYNHFYDPITEMGLSEIPPDIRIRGGIGVDSFTWASIENCPGNDFRGIFGLGANVGKRNTWSWRNVRTYEWLGLTEGNPASRILALTNMFRALGQVVHLLQDASQPQHVRNEQHLDQFWQGGPNTPWRSPIEDYGNTNISTLDFRHGMLDWDGAGFTRLEDFWNTHLYSGAREGLVDDADGTQPLGLAEFSSGNFLGARHLYAEYYHISDIQYYPFPSRDTGTTYNQVKADPLSGLDHFALPNGQLAAAIYVAKVHDGIGVTHHSRINYLGTRIRGLRGKPFCTIDDPNVQHDYHASLIPKAVEYSAGLLDYFFRGTLNVTYSPSTTTPGSVTLQIQNTSGRNFHDGSFQLFSDDSAGNRAAVNVFPYTSGVQVMH